MKWFRMPLAALTVTALVFMMRTTAVEACSPESEPVTIVDLSRPDDMPAFLRGQLGILQAGFDSNEYAVAYRTLLGGALTAEQQKEFLALVPVPVRGAGDDDLANAGRDRREEPAVLWLKARNRYLPPPTAEKAEADLSAAADGSLYYNPSYLNCPDAAFATARETLEQRAALWGKSSPWLMDWIRAQDAVFANCEGKTPVQLAPAPEGAPALLMADRAYQRAAAAFYAKDYDRAEQGFTAIAADAHSPWREWGGYLAARAVVRKAFALGRETESYSEVADFDRPTMLRAQRLLEAELAQGSSAAERRRAQQELDFVRLRTAPGERLAEICAALAGPAPDAEFRQHRDDLDWALRSRILDDSKRQMPSVEKLPPLLAWIVGWRTPDSAPMAYERWRREQSLPWMTLALAKSAPADPFVAELLAAAAKIHPGSPAYDTVFFHRVRLLIGLGRRDEARSLLEAELQREPGPPVSSRGNALRSARAAVARDFPEFLLYASRAIAPAPTKDEGDDYYLCREEGSFSEASRISCSQHKPVSGFDSDALLVLNRQTPLSLLAEAARFPAFTPTLRRQITLMAWMRAVALQDEKAAAQIFPLLPAELRRQAVAPLGHRANLAVLRNWGLRPYLERGIGRNDSYSAYDAFRDNWWNSGLDRQPGDKELAALGLLRPDAAAFLTPQQLAEGEGQYRALAALPDAPTLIGRRVIDYVKAHPADPDAAEALALVVRATHYYVGPIGLDEEYKRAASVNTATSKAAFELLHRNYPRSPWAAKTKYYY